MKKYAKELTIVIILISSMVLICSSAISYRNAIKNKELSKIRETIEDFTWEGFDALPFGQAFNQMYFAFGKKYIFEWRGNKYKTILKEDS